MIDYLNLHRIYPNGDPENNNLRDGDTTKASILIESLQQAIAYKQGDKSAARAVKRTAEEREVDV